MGTGQFSLETTRETFLTIRLTPLTSSLCHILRLRPTQSLQDLARASTKLLSVSQGPITATLLIGHFNHATALRLPLGTFTLPPSLSLPFPYPPIDQLPKAWEAERYSKMPEIHWTYKDKEKEVRKPIALTGTLFILAPWIVLTSIVSIWTG